MARELLLDFLSSSLPQLSLHHSVVECCINMMPACTHTLSCRAPRVLQDRPHQ